MSGYFVIKRKLPSLNEVIGKNRTNKYVGAQFKADIEEAIAWDIRQALTSGTLKPVKKLCIVHFEWHEATRRRDADNIQSSQKFILDALVKNEVLTNDNRRYVKNTTHEIIDDKEKKDFIVVRIEEIG